MSEKEKKLIDRLTETVSKLDSDKQNYVLGISEGMAIMREQEKKKEKEESHEK